MDLFNDAVSAITDQLSGLWPNPAENPHLVNGKLRPCPGTPNCVSSETADPIQKVDPFTFSGSAEQAWDALKTVVAENGGTVRDSDKEYLWSTFTVPVFGFVDDVEFRLSREEGVIHVRSSSRLGFSDLGVNRGRVGQLRGAFRKALQA